MERTLWIVVLATIAWAVCMAIEAGGFDKSRSTGLIGRFASPVAMLELARSPHAFASILDQGDRQKNIEVMRSNTYMDFLFVILYCATLILLGVVCSAGTVLRMILATTVLATGLFDYWENVRLLGLLRVMQSLNPSEAVLPRPVSLVKWALFALDLTLVALAILRSTNKVAEPLLMPMTAFVLLAAACTVIGLFRNNFIDLSVLCLFPALLCAAWIWRP